MELSEEELRMLEQMERALVEEDPKLASTLRGTSFQRAARRRMILGGAILLVGIGLLDRRGAARPDRRPPDDHRRPRLRGDARRRDPGPHLRAQSRSRDAQGSRLGPHRVRRRRRRSPAPSQPPALRAATSWSAWRSGGAVAASAASDHLIAADRRLIAGRPSPAVAARTAAFVRPQRVASRAFRTHRYDSGQRPVGSADQLVDRPGRLVVRGRGRGPARAGARAPRPAPSHDGRRATTRRGAPHAASTPAARDSSTRTGRRRGTARR